MIHIRYWHWWNKFLIFTRIKFWKYNINQSKTIKTIIYYYNIIYYRWCFYVSLLGLFVKSLSQGKQTWHSSASRVQQNAHTYTAPRNVTTDYLQSRGWRLAGMELPFEFAYTSQTPHIKINEGVFIEVGPGQTPQRTIGRTGFSPIRSIKPISTTLRIRRKLSAIFSRVLSQGRTHTNIHTYSFGSRHNCERTCAAMHSCERLHGT